MSPTNPLLEVARLMLRLGFTAFGGPAAHIAMLHDEVVTRRGWLDEQAFLDLLGATNLIPGPNSTEMVIHVSYKRAGWPGLIVGGVCFIAPAMLIVMALSLAYVRYGTLPAAQWLLYGVKPVIIAVIADALWKLGRKALIDWPTGVAVVLALAGYALGSNEIALLAAGGGLVWLLRTGRDRWRSGSGGLPALVLWALPLAGAVLVDFSLNRLFWTFAKIGSVLYGSGYVLLAFLRADFVERFGWLTEQQLIDAIAIGQVTPGPVFTTATFVGTVLGGWQGGLVATAGIFLPAFLFVALSGPLVPRLRRHPAVGHVLDGVNAAALALMIVVTLQLGRAALVDWYTALLLALAGGLLWRYRVNTTWLIAGGALAGWLATVAG